MTPQGVEPYIHTLRSWWERLTTLGSGYGYHQNGSKTWLIVKEGLQGTTTSTFAGTSMQITTQDKHHLGAALGTQSFAKQFVAKQVNESVSEQEQLSNIACSQPQVAYSAHIHGLKSK